MRSQDEQLFPLLVLLAVVALLCSRKKWQASRTAYGTARWATEEILRRAGMLGARGLILGRTLSGLVIRLPAYCHILLVGATGSGKGVSIIIPQLLTYVRGSLITFDVKGDLYQIAGSRKKMGQRIVRIAPFNGGTDSLNPLDSILEDSAMLVDDAHALAAALVVIEGTEPDPHWNAKAVQLIHALLVLVLLRFRGEERNLNSVAEIASDETLLARAADQLRAMGGIPARLGNQIATLFAPEGGLTKEGSGVVSVAQRHLSFLTSELVAKAVATSTIDVRDLLKPGTTVFLQIPASQLESARGLLRLWLATFIRVIGSAGDERSAEVLALIDEAAAAGGLPALEEALIRGRSAGVRLLLAFQSDSQVKVAFKDKPTLLYDNCSTHIYLGGANSIETAERLSKSLGEWTQTVESYSENDSYSWSVGSKGEESSQKNRSSNRSLQPQARALMQGSEILTMSRDYLIALVPGLAPILARRIKYYADPLFGTASAMQLPPPLWWVLLAGAVALIAWAALGGQ